jgi:hypothetical protein
MENKMIELIDICEKIGVTISINHKKESIEMSENLGEFECAEQALQFIKNNYQEELEEIEDDN